MRNTRLATRYARSLITLAKEKDALDVVLADMQYLQEICRVSHDFTLMLRSPIIKGDKKLAITKAVFKDNLSSFTDAFIALLINKGREFFLPEMTDAYIAQYKRLKNIHEISLTTAVELKDDLYHLIKEKVADTFTAGTVELQLKKDESLIGGFVLEAGDMLFDASIRRDLNDIKKQFSKNLYVPNL